MGKKLYVGNLPYDTAETQLQDLFAQAGTVESVKVIREWDGEAANLLKPYLDGLLANPVTVAFYNQIQTMDEKVNQAQGQIQSQLQRRADLVPNLVNTVKGYAQHEEAVFTQVANARATFRLRSSNAAAQPTQYRTSSSSRRSAASVSPASFSSIVVARTGAAAAKLEERGDTLRAEKAYLDALDYYRAALAKNSGSAPLYNKIGINELQLGRFADARKDFERAIKIADNHLIQHHPQRVDVALLSSSCGGPARGPRASPPGSPERRAIRAGPSRRRTR